MALVQWHTQPYEFPEAKVDRIKLDAPYHKATSALQTRLDEFVTYLTDRNFQPPDSFTELCYRYRRIYGEYPQYLSPTEVFVRVADTDELQAAVGPGWSWDRVTVEPIGRDCLGHPAFTWAPYVTNQLLPKRDPSHNYGITDLNRIIHQTLTTVSSTYSCCGKELDHPGCWMGPTKYAIIPYDLAPEFGERVWELVKMQQWDRVRALWESEPQVGTMWLYKERYEAWDQEIRRLKQTLTDPILESLKLELQLRKADIYSVINPIDKLDPLDRTTLETMLELQRRYNAKQCRSNESYDLFRVDIGDKLLVDFTLLFRKQPNLTWSEELEEVRNIMDANPNAPALPFQNYLNFVLGYKDFSDSLDALPSALKRLPQFAPLRNLPVGDADTRRHLNNIIQNDVDYDPTFDAKPLGRALQGRAQAFLEYSPDKLESFGDYGLFRGVQFSIGMDDPLPDLYAQYIIVRSMDEYSTPEDLQYALELDKKQLDIIQKDKEMMRSAISKELDEISQMLEQWPSQEGRPKKTPAEWMQTVTDAMDRTTLIEFEDIIRTAGRYVISTSTKHRQLNAKLIRIRKEALALGKHDGVKADRKNVSMQLLQRLLSEAKNAKTIQDAQLKKDEIQQEVDRILAIPTNEQIMLALDRMRQAGVTDDQLLRRVWDAPTLQVLKEIEDQALLLPSYMIENVRKWVENWPEDEDDAQAREFLKLAKEQQYARAKDMYPFVKERYENALLDAVDKLSAQILTRSQELDKRKRYNDKPEIRARINVWWEGRRERLYPETRAAGVEIIEDLNGIIKRTPEDSSIESLVRRISDLSPINVYADLLSRAEAIKTNAELNEIYELVTRVQELMRDFDYEYAKLQQMGYTVDDLTELRKIMDLPKASEETIQKHLDDFYAAINALPALFPISDKMKAPKEFTRLNMIGFFNRIPPSKNAVLDGLIKEYETVLLRGNDKLLNYDAYRDCWEKFVRAMLIFPGKRIDLLISYLNGEAREMPDEIVALQSAQCLNLNPEEQAQEVWLLPNFERVKQKEPPVQELVEEFIAQSKTAPYNNWPNLTAFAVRLENSEFFRIQRILKGQAAEACSAAFLELLGDIQDKSRDFVEQYQYGDKIVECLDLLENRFYWLGRFDDIRGSRAELQYLQAVLEELPLYVETNREKWPKLYNFIFGLGISFRTLEDEECRKSFRDFLAKLEGRPIETIEKELETWPETKRLQECTQYGYASIIKILKEEPVNVEGLQEVVNAIQTQPQRDNVISLLEEIDAIVKKEEPI